MLSPDFQWMIYKQQERELLRDIELRRKIKEAMTPSQPWYSRIGQWLVEQAAGLKPRQSRYLETAHINCGCSC